MAVRKFSYLLTAAFLLGAAQLGAAQDFFLKKGDVVVVMGDSITEQRLYSNYLEIWSQTRYPSYNLVFRNVGIGGDTSGGGNGRFKRDVVAHKPTVLTVDFGMNDGGYIWPGKTYKVKDPKTKELVEKSFTSAEGDSRLANYLKGQQGIADQAKAANIRVAWITPQPVENTPGAENDKYNATLEKFSEGVKEVVWSGGKLPDDNYDEFVLSTFLTVSLKPGTTLYFPVVQECEQGISRWIEIPQEGKHAEGKSPAPGVKLLPKP